MGWDLLKNGYLIRAADAAGFEVLLTADRKMYDQQRHLERKLALSFLPDRSVVHWKKMRRSSRRPSSGLSPADLS
jgi:hypothetical protein